MLLAVNEADVRRILVYLGPIVHPSPTRSALEDAAPAVDLDVSVRSFLIFALEENKSCPCRVRRMYS